MKVLRAALLEPALDEVPAGSEHASQCFSEGPGADPGCGCAFWPGQPSTGDSELLSSSSVPAAAPSVSPSSEFVVSTVFSLPQRDHNPRNAPSSAAKTQSWWLFFPPV